MRLSCNCYVKIVIQVAVVILLTMVSCSCALSALPVAQPAAGTGAPSTRHVVEVRSKQCLSMKRDIVARAEILFSSHRTLEEEAELLDCIDALGLSGDPEACDVLVNHLVYQPVGITVLPRGNSAPGDRYVCLMALIETGLRAIPAMTRRLSETDDPTTVSLLRTGMQWIGASLYSGPDADRRGADVVIAYLRGLLKEFSEANQRRRITATIDYLETTRFHRPEVPSPLLTSPISQTEIQDTPTTTTTRMEETSAALSLISKADEVDGPVAVTDSVRSIINAKTGDERAAACMRFRKQRQEDIDALIGEAERLMALKTPTDHDEGKLLDIMDAIGETESGQAIYFFARHLNYTPTKLEISGGTYWNVHPSVRRLVIMGGASLQALEFTIRHTDDPVELHLACKALVAIADNVGPSPIGNETAFAFVKAYLHQCASSWIKTYREHTEGASRLLRAVEYLDTSSEAILARQYIIRADRLPPLRPIAPTTRPTTRP